MSSLKSHLALISALVFILISIFLFRLFSNILTNYEKTILNNYSIVIVSNEEISQLSLEEIEEIKKIDITHQIDQIKKRFPTLSLDKVKLPFFYKLQLNTLPSPKRLNKIENILKSYPFIKRVLTYQSSQTKIYNLLMLLKTVTYIFTVIVAILGFLLIIKQLEVWKLEHSERMYIMELFGAPFWFKGASLFKIAFIDSIIALVISIFLIFYILNSAFYNAMLEDLNIFIHLNFYKEFVLLFSISVLISLFSSIVVIIGNKR
ncbi:MAG TPA: hypothetical protein EYH54_00880 [Nautiliaceae bacterium]|nr:hypothetical protein [Nautiliaceae bacterium]